MSTRSEVRRRWNRNDFLEARPVRPQPLRRSLQAFLSKVRIDDQITLYECGQRPRRIAGRPETGWRSWRPSRKSMPGAERELTFSTRLRSRRGRSVGESAPGGDPPEVVIVGRTGPFAHSLPPGKGSSGSSARNTSPMPPWPMRPSTRYRSRGMPRQSSGI